MWDINLEWIINTFRAFRLRDGLDILLLAVLVYQAIKLVRDTRAAQLLKGILFIFFLFFISEYLELRAIRFLTGNVLQVGLFALLVVFQPELRRALEQVGRAKIGNVQVFSKVLTEQEKQQVWRDFIRAVQIEAPVLSKKKTGALMVIERETKLGEIVKTGTVIDAQASAELIGNIFFANSPLHDGAMIVRDGRILAAGCFLPLSENQEISKELGTRHRAALGVTEMSDALVIVVSEETGLITICQNGRLQRGVTIELLEQTLTSELLIGQQPQDSRKKTADSRKGRQRKQSKKMKKLPSSPATESAQPHQATESHQAKEADHE